MSQVKNICEIELPFAIRTYAVVDRRTGSHLVNVHASTFSEVGLNWLPEALGVGEYLIFCPFDGNAAPSPIRVSVTSVGGRWRAKERLASSHDRKAAPAGFRAMLNECGEWIPASTEAVKRLVSLGYMHGRDEIERSMEWAAGNEA